VNRCSNLDPAEKVASRSVRLFFFEEPTRLSLNETAWADLRQGGASQLAEDPACFATEDSKGVKYAFLSTGSQTVERRRPYHHGPRPQGDRLDEVGATPEAAVYDDSDPITDRAGDLGQNLHR
jgi:hypothetical protein